MKTTPGENPGDRPSTEVVLQRPLQGLTRATRLNPEDLIPEALEAHNDKRCVIRQMHAVLGVPEETLEKQLDEIQPFWKDIGITAEPILEYGRKHNITTRCLYMDDLLGKYTPPFRKHCKSMTFAVEGNHAFFFKKGRQPTGRPPVTRKIRVEKKQQPVQYVPYEGLQDGTYYYEDLEGLRLDF